MQYLQNNVFNFTELILEFFFLSEKKIHFSTHLLLGKLDVSELPPIVWAAEDTVSLGFVCFLFHFKYIQLLSFFNNLQMLLYAIFTIQYCSALSKNSLWFLFLAYLWLDNTLSLYSFRQKIYFLFTIRREHQDKKNRIESNGLERKHTHLHLFIKAQSSDFEHIISS